jgi:hypothetical protein
MTNAQIKMPLEIEVEGIIEAVQEAIINSGGKFFKQKEIREMKVEDFLYLIIPNEISVTITWKETKEVK